MTNEYASRLKGFLPTESDLIEFSERSQSADLLNAFGRMTTWIRLLHELRGQDQTVAIIAAAHSKIIEIWILVPLGLLHSSYNALRTFVDICTSYSFYCSHPAEWQAVCEGRASWESRSNIVDWHIRYTPTCREMNKEFGLADSLNKDYQELSTYVHGIPVSGLPRLRGIERTYTSDEDLERFTILASKIDTDLNLFYLSVFHRDLMSLSADDYRVITKGINRGKLASIGIRLPRV